MQPLLTNTRPWTFRVITNKRVKLVICVLMAFLLVSDSPKTRRSKHSVGHPEVIAGGRNTDRSQIHYLYINLDRRVDRKAQVLGQLRAAKLRAERVSAVEPNRTSHVNKTCWDGGGSTCRGQLGCQYSHLKALGRARLEGWGAVAVLEDDFQWAKYVDPLYMSSLIQTVIVAKPDWDIIALSLNIIHQSVLPSLKLSVSPTMQVSVVRIHEAQTTHGYIVRGSYIDKVISAFKKCDIARNYLIAIDTCWKFLQKTDHWYGFYPQIAIQAPGFSDIESREVNYSSQILKSFSI